MHKDKKIGIPGKIENTEKRRIAPSRQATHLNEKRRAHSSGDPARAELKNQPKPKVPEG